jgi:aryl sulfotransferase
LSENHPWPVKSRELVHWVVDSTRWNGFDFRDDDIVIGTWSKAGTTWMQQIVGQLVFNGDPEVFGDARSPWIDARVKPNELEIAAAQTHRRFLKTHLPVDAIVFSPEAKYIYIGRDARDVFWSWHNHHANFTPGALAFINSLPGRIGPPVGYPNPDIRLAFHEWLDQDAYPNWPFWSHVQGWWDVRHLPNVLLVHFADLKADMASEIRRVADFLGIPIDESIWPAILEHCGFEYMKRQAARHELFDMLMQGGGSTFINKGTNGRWRDVLTPEDTAKCDRLAAENLTPDCAHWLATAERLD